MVLEHFAVNERVTGSNPVETEFSDKFNLSEINFLYIIHSIGFSID